MPNRARATFIIAENAPPLKQICIASLYHFRAAAATLTFARTDTHIPAYPLRAEQNAPIRNEIATKKAIRMYDTCLVINEFEVGDLNR